MIIIFNFFFKVVSSIVTEMDLNNERDKENFTELMQMFITFIRRETLDNSNLHVRNSQREIVIIIMRFIGKSIMDQVIGCRFSVLRKIFF